MLLRQYISPVLTTGQTVTGAQALKMQVRAFESNAGNNMVSEFGIRVIGSDLTVRKVVLAPLRTFTTEMSATSIQNRQHTATSAATNYTTVDGDRLCIEVGAGGDPSSTNHHDYALRLGDAAGSDLPENSTSTSDFRPWVQLTDTLTFVSPLGTPTISGMSATTFTNGQDEIVITGTNFGDTSGTAGKVELANANTYAGSTVKVSQAITGWTSTTITFSAVKGGNLAYGTLYLYVTNNDGNTSSQQTITLTAPPPGLTVANLLLTAGNQDAYERNNNTEFTSSSVIVAVQSTSVSNDRYHGGFAFSNSIPKYDEVEEVEMQVWPVTTDDLKAAIVGHMGTPANFATNADVTGRAAVITLAQPVNTQANMGTGAYKTISTDFWYVIQEMINNRGWTTGNIITILFVGQTDAGTLAAWFDSYDANATHAAKIDVSHREPVDLGMQLEEILHPWPGRTLGDTAAAGTPIGFGDPDIFTDHVDGLKKIVAAANRADQTGIDLYIIPFETTGDDWDLARTTILDNVNTTVIGGARPAAPGWDEYRRETPSYVQCTADVGGTPETVSRIYFVGGDTAGTDGPFEIGMMQRDSTTAGAYVPYVSNPVLTATEEFEFAEDGTTPYVFEPSVIYDASLGARPFRMLYNGSQELHLCMADSADGITWSNKAVFYTSAVFPAWSACWGKIGNHYELWASSIGRPGGFSRAWCATPSMTFTDWSSFEGILNAGAGQRWHSDWAHGPAIAEGDDGNSVWAYFGGRDPYHQGTYPHVGRLVVPPMVENVTTVVEDFSRSRSRVRTGAIL